MTDLIIKRTLLYRLRNSFMRCAAVHRNLSSVSRPLCFAFTLAESMVVIVIISLLVTLGAATFNGVLTRNSFRAKSQGLISALEAASTSAAQTGKRYEVIIDIPQQSYILREITTPKLSEVLEEEIIAQEDFGEQCRISYVLFDDGEFTNEDRAKFRASRSGWQFGGIIVLLDADEQPWSVIIDRLSNIVRLETGEAQIAWPRSADELAF
ncbi:MAG: prepilin-type N-terminal cleavage/methylation domain-containing protein [Sedimentisphaerales bacterium]|nr:prepilin-type N-terminal cleavage/methylation domain-containing protein [Sedimentisphaerales bacterium]